MSRTPGIHILIGRAWDLLLDDDDLPEVFSELCLFLRRRIQTSKDRRSIKRNPAALAELVDGWFSGTSIAFSIPPDLPRHGHRIFGGPDALSSVLRSYGVVTAVFICVLSRVTDTDVVREVHDVLRTTLLVMARELFKMKSYWAIRETLRAGILQGIVACGNHTDADIHEQATRILAGVIYPSAIYYTLLPYIEYSLPEIESMAATARFKPPEISGLWHECVDVMEARLEVKRGNHSQTRNGTCRNIPTSWPNPAITEPNTVSKSRVLSKFGKLDGAENNREIVEDLELRARI
ncbi:hypothetical protein FB451DRAFT_1162571 [Mycena latifolia]|nr:hypothetical protein FB451DRAFT_1162571 [Mycena latifolia]